MNSIIDIDEGHKIKDKYTGSDNCPSTILFIEWGAQ